jgi:hypothetical protein
LIIVMTCSDRQDKNVRNGVDSIWIMVRTKCTETKVGNREQRQGNKGCETKVARWRLQGHEVETKVRK